MYLQAYKFGQRLKAKKQTELPSHWVPGWVRQLSLVWELYPSQAHLLVTGAGMVGIVCSHFSGCSQ